jgi:MPBQ/MSBQ methyltransferase
MDAMNMSFPLNSFDVIWACESSEHIPDKGLLIDEITRVLKPNGTFVLAAWCQRDHRQQPFTHEVYDF